MIACLLLLSTLCCVGCKKEQEASTEQRFVLEKDPVLITTEQKEEMTSRIVEVFCATLYEHKNMVLSPEKREQLVALTKGQVIPLLETVLSYNDFEKLSVLNFDISAPDALFDTYLSLSSLLGNEKAGNLFYNFALLYYDQSYQMTMEHYEQYGYSWSLEDAQKYKRQHEQLKNTVAIEDFSTVMSIVSLCAASIDVFAGLEDVSFIREKGGGYLLSLMRRQAKTLDAADNAESLACAGGLLLEFVFGEMRPPEQFSPIEDAEWYAIAENGADLHALCSTIPQFFDLYRAYAYALTQEEADVLLNHADQRAQTVFSVLSRCEEEFVLWAKSVSACTLACEAEKKAIELCKETQAFSAYASQQMPVSAERLATLIALCASNPSDQTAKEELQAALESFAFSVAPYVSYVYVGRK